jgi:hypothetical protein
MTCSKEELAILLSSSELVSVSGSTSIVPTPRTPLDATEIVRPWDSGDSSCVAGRDWRAEFDPRVGVLSWGSVLKKGIGSTTSSVSRDDMVVVLG